LLLASIKRSTFLDYGLNLGIKNCLLLSKFYLGRSQGFSTLSIKVTVGIVTGILHREILKVFGPLAHGTIFRETLLCTLCLIGRPCTPRSQQNTANRTTESLPNWLDIMKSTDVKELYLAWLEPSFCLSDYRDPQGFCEQEGLFEVSALRACLRERLH